MATGTLTIVLDDVPEGTELPIFYAGQVIRGWVYLDVRDTMVAQVLTIELSHYYGGGVGRPEPVVLLHRGGWLPGQYRYPFWFVCPNEPLSYLGPHSILNWQLIAKIGNSHGLFPKGKVRHVNTCFRLLPVPGTPVQLTGAERWLDTRWTRRAMIIVCAFLALGLTLPSLLVGRSVGWEPEGFQEWLEWWWPLLAAWSVFVLVYGLHKLGQLAPQRILRRLKAKVVPVPGNGIEVEYEMEARRPIQSVVVRLVFYEVATLRSEHDLEYFRHTTRRDDAAHNIPVDGSKRCGGRVAFATPDPARYGWSFLASGLRLEWGVLVEVRVKGLTSYELFVPIMVTPGELEKGDNHAIGQ